MVDVYSNVSSKHEPAELCGAGAERTDKMNALDAVRSINIWSIQRLPMESITDVDATTSLLQSKDPKLACTHVQNYACTFFFISVTVYYKKITKKQIILLRPLFNPPLLIQTDNDSPSQDDWMLDQIFLAFNAIWKITSILNLTQSIKTRLGSILCSF